MNPAVLQKLLTRSDELHTDVKIAAITALGEGKATDAAAIAKLLRFADDLNVNVKIAAIKALGRAFR